MRCGGGGVGSGDYLATVSPSPPLPFYDARFHLRGQKKSQTRMVKKLKNKLGVSLSNGVRVIEGFEC